MGAITVSKKEEEQIDRLRKELRIPTKSGLIRAALKTLEEKAEKEKLRWEIRRSVLRCAAADKSFRQEIGPC
jgi:Arc/MetJ-type ribon-helix-helix transcriptional regulator